MWNAVSSNEYLSNKNKTQNQKRHIINIFQAKPLILNDLPWSPSYSLSKSSNKFSIQRNLKVYNDNQVLLKKMMEIDKHAAELSQKNTMKSFNQHKIKSSAGHYRKFQEKFIDTENEKLMYRIQSQKSVYQSKDFQKQNQKAIQYKNNISRKNKQINLDFTLLAKKELMSDMSVFRKSSLSTQAWSSFSKSPKLASLGSPSKNFVNKDQIDFPTV